MTQAGCSKTVDSHSPVHPIPLLLSIHLEITATHLVQEAEKTARGKSLPTESPAPQLPIQASSALQVLGKASCFQELGMAGAECPPYFSSETGTCLEFTKEAKRTPLPLPIGQWSKEDTQMAMVQPHFGDRRLSSRHEVCLLATQKSQGYLMSPLSRMFSKGQSKQTPSSLLILANTAFL